MEKGQLWRQYVFAWTANLACAAIGYSQGWTSPINLKLEAGETPLPEIPNANQIAWLSSLLNIGTILGPFIGGFIISKFGRKWGILFIAVPLFMGWILIAIAGNLTMLYIGRILWGVSVSMAFTVVPIYCTEIATIDARGSLGSVSQFFNTCGLALVYSVGPWVSYEIVSIVGTVVTAVFAMAFYFMPETPIYHLSKGDVDSAGKCLSMIRGRSRAGVQEELDALLADVKSSKENAKTATLLDIFRGSNFKAFYISCALVFFQQFSGVNAVFFYMTSIFNAAGAGLDPAISTIIVVAFQLIASCVAPLAVDRLGSKMLLLISSCGTAIGHGLLGTYFMLSDSGSSAADSIGFLPLVALMIFICAYCVGLGPLPWAVMAELMAIEIKTISTPIVSAFCWSLAFLITRFFGNVADALGMGPTFLIFGSFCAVSFFFTMFLVPETRGKSYQEIQDILAGRSKKKTEKA